MSGERIYDVSSEFPDNHVTITPSNTVNLSQPMVIVAGTTGTISIVDKYDRAVTYTVGTALTVLPVLAKRVNATGTTVTQVIGLY